MSEIVACPTCQAMLRLPATATTIRCPQCKTVMNVSEPTAPAEPAVSLPLPFGKPKPKPAANLKIATRPTKKTTKAVLVDEAAEEAEIESLAKAQHRKQVKADLVVLEAGDEIKGQKYERLQELVAYSRRAVVLFTWAARVQLLGLVIVFGILGTFMTFILVEVASSLQGRGSVDAKEILGATVMVAVPLCAILAGLQALLTGIGMVFVALGTKRARYLGYLGCAVCLFHVLFAILQATRALIGLARREFIVSSTDSLWVQLQPVYDLFGMVTDLPLISEQPTRLLWGHPLSYFGILAAVFEFTRMVLVGVIAQNYAEDGKAVELGYRSYKAIGRIFWVVMLAGVARLVGSIAFDWARADEAFLVVLGLACHAIITFGTYLCLSLSVLGQMNALNDTIEVMDPIRFAAETDNLEI